ncbi:hypothetical protein [Mucilaginibacter auburnensis]|nr:hypothetical protein [Mucilaginibacter auburnensis]
MNRPNLTFKTKADTQSFVVLALILFVLFVKCYMVVTGYTLNNTAKNRQHNDTRIAVIKNNM